MSATTSRELGREREPAQSAVFQPDTLGGSFLHDQAWGLLCFSSLGNKMFTPELSIAIVTLNSKQPQPLSKHLCLSTSLWVSWEVVLSGPSLADLSVAGHASAGALDEAGRTGMALAGSPCSVPHDLSSHSRLALFPWRRWGPRERAETSQAP